MRTSSDLFEQLPVDKELVTKFFITFSRFEYALKRGGYANGNENEVKANWDTLARDLREHFQPDRTDELRRAVDYIERHPPKKQIWKDHELGWANNTRPPNGPQLLSLTCFIRTVRNNLFHGGKFLPSSVRDVSRDSTLLDSSLIILDECLRLCGEVKPDVHYHFFHFE